MSGSNYTPEQLEAATKALFVLALTSYPHDLALGAYATVACAHPCCLDASAACTANLAMHLHGLLAQRDAGPGQHPASTAVH